jgi:MFS family permease
MSSSLQTKQAGRGLVIFQPFRHSRYFTALFFGQIFSFLGSSITMVILPIVVFELSNSTAMMGTVMALYMLPNVIMLPFAGILVDKVNRIHMMFAVDILRFMVMLVLCLLAFFNQLTMTYLFVLVFLMGLMDGFFHPAYSSVKAKVFTKDIRNAANSITQVSQQGIRLLGPILGGVIVTSLSAGWGFGLDALTYIISLMFLFNLRSLSSQQLNTNIEGKNSIKRDFIEGIDVLKQTSWLWITILAFSFINICAGGVTMVLIPWLINIHHHFEPVVYGLVLSSSGAGAIVCGVVFGLRKEWKKRGILAYAGVALSGLALLCTPLVSNVPLLMLLMFMDGAGIMLFGLIWETSLQELVPEEKFGRVSSLDMLGSFALLPIGYLATGWLAEGIGEIRTLVILCSVICIISVGVLFNKGIRGFE